MYLCVYFNLSTETARVASWRTSCLLQTTFPEHLIVAGNDWHLGSEGYGTAGVPWLLYCVGFGGEENIYLFWFVCLHLASVLSLESPSPLNTLSTCVISVQFSGHGFFRAQCTKCCLRQWWNKSLGPCPVLTLFVHAFLISAVCRTVVTAFSVIITPAVGCLSVLTWYRV